MNADADPGMGVDESHGVRRVFVQGAEVALAADADAAAPGGAVTQALCGSWEHEGPCRWPHRTSMTVEGGRGLVRVVFVAIAEDEAQVRAAIDTALTGGECVGPDGKRNRWEGASLGACVPCGEEAKVGAGLAALPYR